MTRRKREALNGHRSLVIWFTGLSGSGKSTLANELEQKLHEKKCRTVVIDGDNLRHGLCADLGFSEDDRTENIRRVGEIARLFVNAGVVTIMAFISPFMADRERVRHLFDSNDFIEIYCSAPISSCELRDVKGLYAKARLGLISSFTGITSPYEPPVNPELTIDTSDMAIEVCVSLILDYLSSKGLLSP